MFHSAQWNHDVSLAGKRVAVIGTGASAIQIVPAIAGQVQHLDVYPAHRAVDPPRADRPYTKLERFAFKHVPGFQRLSRAGIYAMRETQVVGLAKAPAFMKPLQWASENHLRTQIKDKALRAKVTPNFRIGCKRMLISNAYYPALAQSNVDLVTDGIAEVRKGSIVTKDGTERPIDALVVATGFHVTDSPRTRASPVRTVARWPKPSTTVASRVTRAQRWRTSPTCSSWWGRTPASDTPRWSS